MTVTVIEVLGAGCRKCDLLERNAREAISTLGQDREVEIRKVTDMDAIVDKGVFVTPALVIDGVVRSTGRVLSPEQIRLLLA